LAKDKIILDQDPVLWFHWTQLLTKLKENNQVNKYHLKI